MKIRILCCVLLAGCGDELLCGDFTTQADGFCVGQEPVEPEAPSFTDAILALDKCTHSTGDGSLDVTAGCVGDGCIGDTYGELNTAFGAVGSCDAPLESFPEYLSCEWPNGVSTLFRDNDLDGEPDEPASFLSVDEPFEGQSDDGLGLGVEAGCFVRSLGMPDSGSFIDVNGAWTLSEADWEGAGVQINDRFGAIAYEPDGYIDSIMLY